MVDYQGTEELDIDEFEWLMECKWGQPQALWLFRWAYASNNGAELLSSEAVASGFAEEHDLHWDEEEIMKFTLDLYNEENGVTNFDNFWYSMPCEDVW